MASAGLRWWPQRGIRKPPWASTRLQGVSATFSGHRDIQGNSATSSEAQGCMEPHGSLVRHREASQVVGRAQQCLAGYRCGIGRPHDAATGLEKGLRGGDKGLGSEVRTRLGKAFGLQRW